MTPHAALKERSLAAVRVARALLSSCSAPGCTTLTMGGTCVEHDAPSVVVYPRGRPYPPLRTVSSVARR